MSQHTIPLSEEFTLVVADLMTGTHTVEVFINLADSISIGGSILQTNDMNDCTEDLLRALDWGIRQYGLDIIRGYDFFRGLARFNNALCSRLSPVKKLERMYRGTDGKIYDENNIPRPFSLTKPVESEESSIQQIAAQLLVQQGEGTLGLTTLNIGFSEKFSTPCIAILSEEEIRIEPPVCLLPVAIVYGKFTSLSGHLSIVQKATRFLDGDAVGLDRKLRYNDLRKLADPQRANITGPLILPGSSISAMNNDDSAGSAGIFIRPKTFNETYPHSQPFLLTAAHVVKQLDPTPYETYYQPLPASVDNVTAANIISPGKLHILKILSQLQILGLFNATTLAPWVLAAEKSCGHVVAGRLGVDKSSWREDVALIHVDSEYCGKNGSWHDLPELLKLFREMGGNAAGFVGKIIGVVDGKNLSNALCYKNGSASGWSVGKFHSHKVEIFLKGTVHEKDIHSENVVCAQVEMVQAVENTGAFAEAGDSGSPILSPTLDGKNFVFCGMVIGAFDPRVGDRVVFAVPQSRIFDQIQVLTGVEWELDI
ncbi:hypothetical protein BGX38DRAFT_1263696 [Terfezia claveryi]|nr:hypothetical protein BGX38DRAFT_1263696 [Terfezia claveryi]